jgi:two-component system CheB/CheR fusion protein
LFFRSLAKAKAGRGACIILSGTGNDGTIGLKAVKKAGGLTMVQDPDDAQYPGMPQSAIDTGLADFVLPVEEMAEELTGYKEGLANISISDEDEEDRKALQKIFSNVLSHTGHDFSNYKRSSVLRRIERRMQVNRVADLSGYRDYLSDHPEETGELFKDLLISVTNFFRDPEAFDELESTIIPKLFEDKEPDDQVRVWVPGCATGEEAYSIAMLLLEHARTLDDPPDIKVFASDIDEAALNVGRKARYPESITADVAKGRLRRHFNKDGPEYQLKKEVREMVLFASHDLLRDPLFSNQDLIACRNLLIYLNSDLQAEVFNLFHYTLRPEGFLFLGLSDSNLQATELFTPADKVKRIYRRNAMSKSNSRLPHYPLRLTKRGLSPTQRRSKFKHRASNYETLHRRLLTSLYAPQSVIINENFEVLHATDNIQKFLEYSGGEPSHDVIEMAKTELRQPLRSLLFQVEKTERGTQRKKVQMVTMNSRKQVEIIVHRINETDFSDGLMQIVFKELKQPPTVKSTVKKDEDEKQQDGKSETIDNLGEELEFTKEHLQITVEEYETSNEELRASNEELQSINEELQSTTEELETSQEELQSVNEELKAVNEELENEVQKLDKANSDLKNLMEATEVGILFVDNDFCVQRFTSASTEIFNLINSDIGRPMHHVTHHLDYDDLMNDIKSVYDDLGKIKMVVKTKDDRWYIMRIRPYRSTENKIEGVVLSFVEFTELKDAREIAQNRQEALATLGIYALERQDLEAVMQRAIDLSCIILDLDCAVIFALNEEHGTLGIVAQDGCATEIEPVEIRDEWDIGYALSNEDPTVVDNYEEEERFAISPFLKDEGVVSSINVTVRGHDDTYGLLGFYAREPRKFTQDEIHFVQVVSNIVGMAIKNNYAREDLNKEVERSKKFQREILNNSMAERWQLGSYLHDNLAQLLVTLKISTAEIRQKLAESDINISNEISQMNTIIDEGIAGIRDLTHDVVPIDFEEEGVAHAFRFLVVQTRKMYNAKCTIETDAVVDDIKNRNLATNLYHVIQEAVKNAAIHGQSDHIDVSITKFDGRLKMQVEDDGVGLSSTRKDNKGRGVRIMRHRMELQGGTFDIEEKSGNGQSGMVVTCTIPLEYLTKEE